MSTCLCVNARQEEALNDSECHSKEDLKPTIWNMEGFCCAFNFFFLSLNLSNSALSSCLRTFQMFERGQKLSEKSHHHIINQAIVTSQRHF